MLVCEYERRMQTVYLESPGGVCSDDGGGGGEEPMAGWTLHCEAAAITSGVANGVSEVDCSPL